MRAARAARALGTAAALIALAGCAGSGSGGSSSPCGDVSGRYTLTTRLDGSLPNTCTGIGNDPSVVEIYDNGDGTADLVIAGTGGSCRGRLAECDFMADCRSTDGAAALNVSWSFDDRGFTGGSSLHAKAGLVQATACDNNTIDTGAKK